MIFRFTQAKEITSKFANSGKTLSNLFRFNQVKLKPLMVFAAFTLAFLPMGIWGQTPIPMSSQPGLTYTENFSDVANWTNNFASGTGANRWASYPITSGGTANDGKRTTKSSATFSTTTAGGVQKGTGNLVFLSTGSGTTSEAVAVDLLMDFTGVSAGTLSYNWTAIDNSSGTRPTSLRVFWSTDNTTFTEITAAQVIDVQSPTTGSITTVSLPSAFNNSSTARLRFYNHAGTVTGANNRDKISIDDVTVTAIGCSLTTPVGTFNTGTSNCGSTEITYTGTIPGGETYYWQTTATGTATTYPVTSGAFFNAPSSGTWYVRSNVTTCWSPALTGPTITVTLAPTISSQPTNTSVVTGNTATFSVTASNATGYQWQFSTDNGGNWNDVTSGTGATTASYTTATTTAGMNGYQYRVIVNGTSPCAAVTSNGLATLTVYSASVNAISNQTNVYGSTPSLTATATGAVSTWSGNLPAGLSINASTGVITGTLSQDVSGSPFACSVTANFTAGGSDTKNFTWTITPKALTVSGITAANKVYDGNTGASLSGTASLNGIVGADNVTLSGVATGTFSDKNVGTNKVVTISGYTLAGTKAGNYTLTQPTTTANITVKALTVSGATAQDKVYNGTTAATITGATLVGVISPDVVNVSGGGTFADPNAANGIAVTASLSLSGADAGNYTLTQPTGLAANITKANPVFTTSTINVTVGGTYSLPGANISSTSNGAFSYSITGGGNATLGGTTITGVTVGTETLTVNQAASTNYNAGSTTVTVNVTTITYVNGDYRSTGTGNWVSNNATPAIWQRYNGTSWATSNSPAYNTTNNVYIESGHTITATGSFGNTVKLKIKNNGELIVTNSSTAESIYVYEGGTLTVNASLTINGTFDVEDNAIVNLNFDFGNPTTSIWKGNENFRPESILIISNWDNTVPLYNGDVSANTHNSYTAVFGNVYIDISGGTMTGNWNLLGSATGTVNLTHKNFEFDSPNGYDIRFFGTTSFTINATIHGDLRMNSGWSSARKVILGTAGTTNVVIDGDLVIDCAGDFAVRAANSVSSPVNLTVNGDIIMNGPNTTTNTEFMMNVNVYGTPNGTKSIVNLKGNLLVGSNPKIVNKAPYDDVVFNFNGTTTQLLDVASIVASSDKGIPFFIKNGAYVQLSNNNFTVSNGTTIDVEAGGTLDFAWASNGTTPLAILDNGTGTNTFTSRAASILKITSPDGITSLPSTLGNVRFSGGRTYESLGDFHYIGKVSQNDGNGLPMEIRNLIINNTGSTGNNFVTLTTTPTKNVHNTLTMIVGNVYSTASNLLVLGANTSELGTLNYFSGYVIGQMRRWFTGTNPNDNATSLFPMGYNASGLKNRHVRVNYTSAATAGGHLTTQFIGSPMGNAGLVILEPQTGGFGADVTTTEDEGYWKIDNETAKLTDGTYTIACTGEGLSLATITSYTGVTLLKRVIANGPDWFCPGTHLPTTGSNAMPTVSRSGVTGWSNFGFGGNSNNPLPTDLISFSASCEEDAIDIRWATASEHNADYFIVESSRNMGSWTEVSKVQAAGNSSITQLYTVSDLNVLNGTSYYRLTQVDYNGNSKIYDPLSITCNELNMDEYLLAYPNPTNGSFVVTWNNLNLEGNVSISLSSSTGAVISQRMIELTSGKSMIPYDEKLEMGVYFITLTSKNRSITTKLIVN